MRSKVGLLAGWTLVTLTAVFVTSTAVESVRANVTDSAAPAFVLQSGEDPTRDDIAGTSSQAFPTVPDTTALADPDLATFEPPPTESETTTATTLAEPTASVPPAVKTYLVIGGSVTVSGTPDQVTLLGAVPNSGFSAREDQRDDPATVVVTFESTSHKSTIEITWSDGELTPTADEDTKN